MNCNIIYFTGHYKHVAYCSVVMEVWQSEHIRTGTSNPIGGNVDCWSEHLAQTTLPHFLQ